MSFMNSSLWIYVTVIPCLVAALTLLSWHLTRCGWSYRAHARGILKHVRMPKAVPLLCNLWDRAGDWRGPLSARPSRLFPSLSPCLCRYSIPLYCVHEVAPPLFPLLQSAQCFPPRGFGLVLFTCNEWCPLNVLLVLLEGFYRTVVGCVVSTVILMHGIMCLLGILMCLPLGMRLQVQMIQ